MTRVRKINLSQVEGDGANNTSTSEIRPYGEMGVYVGNNNKLELLMFDGVRTNLRSKVLAKGTFYGGDADGGDGTGLDTIKLIPDAVLHRAGGDYDNDQYIIIDPTETNHIHVRAGGAIDASTAFLILGGEENHVGVSDYADQVTIRTNDTHTWLFGSDGRITFPDNTIQTTAYPGLDPNVWVQDFETSLGAPADVPLMASSVEYLANGDVVALFYHSVNNDSNTYSGVARFDSYGTKVWSMKFEGNDGDIYANGWGLAVDNNNGFIYVAGVKSAATGYQVAILTKLSEIDGGVVWSKQYDVGYANSNMVVDVASDGSPVVVGYASNGTDRQVVTTKINATDGSVTWSRALDGQGVEDAYGMAVGPNNEVVSVGYMSQLGVTDGAATLYTVPASNPNWTSPLDADVGGVNFSVTFTDGVPTFTNVSDTLGNRTVDGVLGVIGGNAFGGTSPADDMTIKVATVAANDTDDRMLIVKYNSAGAIQWQRAVQVEVGYDCKGADADIDGSGNIYVCGNFDYDDVGNTEQAIIMFKFDSAGVKQWSRKVQGDCEDFAASIVVGSDGYLYLSAVTGNDSTNDYSMVIAKYNTNGTVVWQRLLDNTTAWTFSGSLFFNNSGGSNLAVRNGYVAVSGSFGDPGATPHAVVAQVTSDGTLFTAGDYDFIAASFSGVLDSAASNITVTDAGKTDSDYIEEFTTSNFSPTVDLTSDLIGTLYVQGSVNIDSIDNGIYSVSVGTDGVVTMTTSRGGLEFGALPEPGGPTHFHIMRPAGESGSGGTDLYFGDDFNYVLQRADSYNGSPAYGVEIGTNDNDGGDQQVWRFETDGDLTIPGNIKSTTDASIVVGSIYSPVTGVNVQAVDELVPPGGVWRIFISATTYSSLGTTVQVGDTVTTTWGTPVTATIIDVLQLEGTWRFHVAQNIVTGFSAGDTVTFNPVSVTWTFAEDGTTTLPADSSILTNETALKIATHSTTTYTFNQAYWEALNGNATRMLTTTGNAQYFSCTVTANQDGTYTVADLTGNSFEPGDWFKVPGNELGGVTPANDIQINIATVDGEGVILTTTITGTAVGKQWQFGTEGNLTLPNGGVIRIDGNNVEVGSVTNFNVEAAGVVNFYTNNGAHQWQFGDDGKLTAPGNLQVDGGKIILNTGGNAYVESVDYGVNSANSAVNIFGGPYQKIKLRAGFGTEASWTFGTDGTLTLPGTMTIETTYGGGPRLVIDGKTNYVDIRSDSNILIGYNDSSGNVTIGNGTSGRVDILGPKFRVTATVPTSSTGADGDMVGMIAVGGGYLYVCTANWVSPGTADIWTRTTLTTGAW